MDYDVIGFDVDNTIVKYNLAEVSKLIIQTYLTDLHDNFKGYPKETTDFDFDNHHSLQLNNAVWDIENGNILKLAENKLVVAAVKGFDKLTQIEIIATYGNPPIYK